jgi:hypothetical protein
MRGLQVRWLAALLAYNQDVVWTRLAAEQFVEHTVAERRVLREIINPGVASGMLLAGRARDVPTPIPAAALSHDRNVQIEAKRPQVAVEVSFDTPHEPKVEVLGIIVPSARSGPIGGFWITTYSAAPVVAKPSSADRF